MEKTEKMEKNELFDDLLAAISRRTGRVIENTVRESSLVGSVRASIQEDLAEIRQRSGSTEVKELIKGIMRSLNFLEGRQKVKSLENMETLKESLTVSVDAIRNLKHLTSDKSILEFEIKLLEQFLITSRVVKDWKEHIRHILLEMNQVLDAHFLFSFFRVDGESHMVDVFWRGCPPPVVQNRVERAIRKRISSRPLGMADPQVVHEIVCPGTNLPDLGEDGLTLSTKEIALDFPPMAGIVGLGVHLDPTKHLLDLSRTLSDGSAPPPSTKSLVIESILTALLNMIGSTKAIRKYTRDLERYATRDPLTGLYNQRVFWELLDYEVGRANRYGHSFAVIIVDCDNFKTINDTHGHKFGDQYLLNLAETLGASTRQGDIIARYGGDEFVCILPETDLEEAHMVADRLVANTKELILPAGNGSKVMATASVGLAAFPAHAAEAKDLFLVADSMLYRSKSLGKNRVSLPGLEDAAEVFRSRSLKHALVQQALEECRVIPHFQPIVDAANGKIYAYEVLMRINQKDKILEAGEFIAVAEASGLINKLDYMIMEKALVKMKGASFPGKLFLNLSPKALITQDFIPTVKRIVREAKVDPSKIVFEITERDTFQNLNLMEKFVRDLKVEGFNFAVDDFGSGFSSLTYLKRFPVDYLKIEGDFVKGMLGKEGGVDRAIIASISSLAKSINLRTIAEAVESEEILTAVREAGLDHAQGYHTGRPGPDLLDNFPFAPEDEMTA